MMILSYRMKNGWIHPMKNDWNSRKNGWNYQKTGSQSFRMMSCLMTCNYWMTDLDCNCCWIWSVMMNEQSKRSGWAVNMSTLMYLMNLIYMHCCSLMYLNYNLVYTLFLVWYKLVYNSFVL